MDKPTVKDIQSIGKAAQGRHEYLDYLQGRNISPERSILAACYRCRNYYADGKKDCETHDCPLYPFMPYTKGRLRVKQESSVERKKQSLRSARTDSSLVNT